MTSLTVRNPQVTAVSTPSSVSRIAVTPGGGGGSGGGAAQQPFSYLMPTAQTTAVFDHTLGHDPTSIQVIVDGQVCDEYSVSFPLANQRVMVGFDVSVQALIRIF